MKIKKIFKHSIKMLKINKKLYINLSIALVLSFTFSLGVLLYFDEKDYNESKEVLSKPEELIAISNPNKEKIGPIKRFIDGDKLTVSYDYYMQGTRKNEIDFEVYMIPSNIKSMYLDDTSYININGENDIIDLDDDEVYVYKEFMEICGRQKYIDVPIRLNNGEEITKKYRVKGYFEIEGNEFEHNTNEIVYDVEIGKYCGRTSLIIVDKEKMDLYKENSATIIYTKNHEKIISLLNMHNIEYNAPILWKNTINEEMYKTKILECIVLVFTYIILGMNIQSIAVNTLEKRKYEIAVQRTVGANKKDIIFQFIIESGLVTIVATIMAIWIDFVLNCVYKLWNYYLYNKEITIYISSGSAAIFLSFVFQLWRL